MKSQMLVLPMVDVQLLILRSSRSYITINRNINLTIFDSGQFTTVHIRKK
jgi:hypothetical protein